MPEDARSLPNTHGAVLIDVLVGLTILALAAGGIFAGFKGSLGAWTIAQQLTGEQHNARLVLDWAARRLRAVGSGYTGAPFLRAEANNIVFVGDTDGNGQVECHRLYLNATQGVVYTARLEPLPGTLSQCESAVGDPLTASIEARSLAVTALTLRYFNDESGGGVEYTPPVTDPLARSRIRRVQITILARGLQSPDVLEMSTDVFIRR
ncbi:MAG: hypothetical protein A2Z07_02540 [Armatimonadetes bacterium RBG_16_67_12]|nr:MAG: hypothetical protein A2Z07_02540 [Armatimonadetes bacterium RBG_16_67_12]